MRKITLLVALTFCAIFMSFAQFQTSQFNKYRTSCDKDFADMRAYEVHNMSANNKAVGDTILSFDFETGIPAGWTTVDESGNDFVWEYADTVRTGAWTDTELNDFLYFDTKENGFLAINADHYNSIGWPPVMVTTPIEFDSYVESDWLDLTSSADAGAFISFQTRYRFCCSFEEARFMLKVSTNGTDWTEYDISGITKLGDYNNGPDLDVNINISGAISADPSILYISIFVSLAFEIFTIPVDGFGYTDIELANGLSLIDICHPCINNSIPGCTSVKNHSPFILIDVEISKY